MKYLPRLGTKPMPMSKEELPEGTVPDFGDTIRNTDFSGSIFPTFDQGFSAAQTFFTDDKIENCEAAAKLGINTHHFTSAQKLFEDWSKYF